MVKNVARPKVRLSVSEWADKGRIIPRGTSPEPGRWRTSRVPYLAEPMNAFSDIRVETVVMMMSSQVGKSEVLLNVIGYYADHEPAPILVVQPNGDMMNAFSKERVSPMFNESPGLKGKLDEGAEGRTSSRKSSNTINIKHFPGGYLAFASSYAPAGLATRPIRIVLLDEVDRYGTTKEGNPIRISIQRSENFYNRKIGIVSTPTMEGQSNVESWWERSDKRLYFVPCSHCGVMQTLEWENVQWEEGKPGTAVYVCPHCEGVIRERDRDKMVGNGEWRPTAPDSEIRGYHINALYSPWSRFVSLAREWSNAVNSGDRDAMMAFVNLKLGRPWRNISMRAEESAILEARTDLPPQTVPEDALALVAGIDQQKLGFWFVVRAWARDYTSWLIDYGFLSAWEDLEELLFNSAYPVQGSSGQKTIWRAALDTGGGSTDGGVSMTEAAYWWLRKNGKGRGCRVWGVKGASWKMEERVRPGYSLDRAPSGRRIPGGLQIVSLNTSELKETYHFRLAQAREGAVQAAYLHSEVGEDYARQIKAEEKQVNKNGTEEWVKVGRDNDLLDCEVYCHAAVDPGWPGGGLKLLRPPSGSGGKGGKSAQPKGQGSSRQPRKRPSWFNRR